MYKPLRTLLLISVASIGSFLSTCHHELPHTINALNTAITQKRLKRRDAMLILEAIESGFVQLKNRTIQEEFLAILKKMSTLRKSFSNYQTNKANYVDELSAFCVKHQKEITFVSPWANATYEENPFKLTAYYLHQAIIAQPVLSSIMFFGNVIATGALLYRYIKTKKGSDQNSPDHETKKS